MYDTLTRKIEAATRVARPPSIAARTRARRSSEYLFPCGHAIAAPHLAVTTANHTFSCSGSPFSDSSQCGYALDPRSESRSGSRIVAQGVGSSQARQAAAAPCRQVRRHRIDRQFQYSRQFQYLRIGREENPKTA